MGTSRTHTADDPVTTLAIAAAMTPDAEVPCRMAPERWYSGTREDMDRAKQDCKGTPGLFRPCALLDLCRAAAHHRKEDFGVWGGETVRERRRALRAANTPPKETDSAVPPEQPEGPPPAAAA